MGKRTTVWLSQKTAAEAVELLDKYAGLLGYVGQTKEAAVANKTAITIEKHLIAAEER